MNIKSYITALLLLVSGQLIAQSLSTSFDHLEDYYRREQLLGNISSDHSFVSYPLFPANAFSVKDPFAPVETIDRFFDSDFNGVWKSNTDQIQIKILPVVWNNQFNSNHPEDWNDGIMIPAKGYQTTVTAGVFLKFAPLTIKIQPEYIYAANEQYEGFPLTRENSELATLRWAQYYFHTLNNIDQPEMFGEGPYKKLTWGQSSIRLTYKSVSFGYSNENIWWGPGIRNTLLMTNTAPGFGHFTLNTVKPIKTIIGSFEGQIISGNLKGSGYPPPNTEVADHNGKNFYSPKRDEDRYFNGMVLNYNPKWIKGLHVGLIRAFQMYREDMDSTFNAYLPIFSPFNEKKLQTERKEGEELKLSNHEKRDQYYSFFMRYVWTASHVEIYGEYGFSDNHWDGRDFMIEVEHSRAYNLGFRKLIMLKNNSKDIFQVGLELTHLSKNPVSVKRGAQEIYTQGSKTWYTSTSIRHGYTHNGQMLGAGIGPGSNLQSLNIGWNRELKSVALLLERYVHNNDFHNENIEDVRMHWVDMVATLNGSWDYKNLLFNFKLKFVEAKNYQWLFDYNINDYWDTSGADDVFNFHGQIGVMYRF